MVTEANVADWMGVSRARVSDLISSGKLPAPTSGRWDAGDVMPKVCALLRQGLAGPVKEVESIRKIAAQRTLLEIQVAKAKGVLVDAAEALRQLEFMAAAVRNKLLNAPERYGLPRAPFVEILKELAAGKHES